jgi:hypothetical protein
MEKLDMNKSTLRRWKLGWMGAGLACLSLYHTGCSSTTAVSDSRTPARSNQQIAAAKKADADKMASRQVASKDAPAKVRISDLDGPTRVQMAAKVGQKNSSAGAPAPNSIANSSRPTSGVVANQATRAAPASSPPVGPTTGGTVSSTVAQKQRPASGSTKQRPANEIAANTRATAGKITQTAGDSRSFPAQTSRPEPTGVTIRPVINPQKSAWQPENGSNLTASSHERRRADRLMQRAYTMYESGYREEALRLASVAAELEYSRLAVYQRGEDRPSDFVEFLLISRGANRPSASAESTFRTPTTAPEPSRTKRVLESSAAGDSSSTRSSGRSARAGEVLPAEALSLPQTARDLKPAPASTPHFVTGDQVRSSAAANAGHLEVPLAETTRNPDVSVVTADGNGLNLDQATTAGGLRTVVTADRVDDTDERSASQKVLAVKAPAPVPEPAKEGQIEPLADVEAPAQAPAHSSSQLTIASLVGLVTGVAGMLGLGWWRRQERRHYAAGK